ncbi:MAG: hypothetical protein JW755_10960, partial [Candidatus Aminicenantes bacterium]|nr:hypothetical protein [Candidatus Aminicenantes bacterium]
KGENPPQGAVINYYLGKEAKEAKLIVADWKEIQKKEVDLKDQSNINRYIWDFTFDPPELNEEEKELYDLYIKTTEWETRSEINEKLQESLEKRGQKYAGINRRTQKLNPIPAEPGMYKVILEADGSSLMKPLFVRNDPLLN